MKWIEIMVETPQENEDIVSHILYKAGTQGLEIENSNDIINSVANKKFWEVDLAGLSNINEDDLIIKAYFSEQEDTKTIINFIKGHIGTQSLDSTGKTYGKVSIKEIDDKNWAGSWKKYYKTKRVGKNIVIKPTWEDFAQSENDIVIELDPGMAFGTGTHETTIMCIEALESTVRSQDRIYDIGCGSGILSITAAKLGAQRVIGIDLDPKAVVVAKENIKNSNINDKVVIVQGDLLDTIDHKADIIVANILAEAAVHMTKDVKEYLKEEGIFISSGIILDKIDLVKETLLDNGFQINEIKTMNEWACIIASLK